jgi:hypothetical protein
MSQPTISGITSLGVVVDEDIQINNRLLSLKRPLGSTENTTVINLGGKQRTITIQGVQTATDYAGATADQRIANFIADVEDWLNSNVQSGRTYTDSFGNTYNVLGNVFRWVRTSPGNRIVYTLSMIEGGAIAAFSP